MKHATSFLSAYEMPRPVQLRRNLFAAFFPLMKLLPARFMLDRAVDGGLLKQGGHIVETTSGTFGLALAMLSAIGGYKLGLVSADSLIDDVMLRRLTSLGAEVHIVGDPEKSGAQGRTPSRRCSVRCRRRSGRVNMTILTTGKPMEGWPNGFWICSVRSTA